MNTLFNILYFYLYFWGLAVVVVRRSNNYTSNLCMNTIFNILYFYLYFWGLAVVIVHRSVLSVLEEGQRKDRVVDKQNVEEARGPGDDFLKIFYICTIVHNNHNTGDLLKSTGVH